MTIFPLEIVSTGERRNQSSRVAYIPLILGLSDEVLNYRIATHPATTCNEGDLWLWQRHVDLCWTVVTLLSHDVEESSRTNFACLC